MNKNNSLIPIKRIESKILFIRGHKVMLDKDLAELYDVKPIALRQQVKRNVDRFPEDFMFQLNSSESDLLVSQCVIPSKVSLGGYLPYVFTQEGVAMLSSVLRSKRAIAINIQIMRAFVRMRDMLETNAKFAAKLKELEDRLDMHDGNTIVIMETLRKLLKESKEKTSAPKKKIGFDTIP